MKIIYKVIKSKKSLKIFSPNKNLQKSKNSQLILEMRVKSLMFKKI